MILVVSSIMIGCSNSKMMMRSLPLDPCLDPRYNLSCIKVPQQVTVPGTVRGEIPFDNQEQQ